MAAAVIVHGGCGTIPSHLVEPCLRGCEKAALEAHRALLDGKSALDAGGSKTSLVPIPRPYRSRSQKMVKLVPRVPPPSNTKDTPPTKGNQLVQTVLMSL